MVNYLQTELVEKQMYKFWDEMFCSLRGETLELQKCHERLQRRTKQRRKLLGLAWTSKQDSGAVSGQTGHSGDALLGRGGGLYQGGPQFLTGDGSECGSFTQRDRQVATRTTSLDGRAVQGERENKSGFGRTNPTTYSSPESGDGEVYSGYGKTMRKTNEEFAERPISDLDVGTTCGDCVEQTDGDGVGNLISFPMSSVVDGDDGSVDIHGGGCVGDNKANVTQIVGWLAVGGFIFGIYCFTFLSVGIVIGLLK